MDSQAIVPSIALTINLSEPGNSEPRDIGPTAEKSRQMASTLRSLGLPATWILDEPQQAKCLEGVQLATTAQEIALTASARSPQRLRSELANRQAAVRAASGLSVSAIAGDPQQLRARTALLADLGIRAIVSAGATTEPKPPRPMPCGIWQLDPKVSLPQTRRWSFLPARRLTAVQLVSMGSATQPVMVSIDLGRLGSRDLQNCQRLLEDIADSQRKQQMTVATISEVATLLTDQNEIKPQRSILRRAA